MKNNKVVVKDLEATLTKKGVSNNQQEQIIQRLQVNGCLIAMVSDVLDSLINDEEALLRFLELKYKNEQKYHKSQMTKAAKDFSYHMKEFTKNFFGDKAIQDGLEDHAQDIYDIIKLLADHTDSHKDMEAIKRNLRKRKLNHHIFDEI